MKQIQIFIFSVVILSLLSCNDNNGNKKKRIPTFPVVKAEKKELTGYDSYPASLEGIENIEIRPKIQGFIKKIHVDEGEQVVKGQMLFRLEADALDAEAQAANDAIKNAEANLAAAQLEVDKLKPLVKKGIISRVELQSAQTNLNAARARLEQSQSSYKSAKRTVDYRNITSPVNGRVGSIPMKTGALVSASVEMPLTTISNTKSMYAYFSMNEKDYVNFLKKTNGETLNEKIDNFPEVLLKLANGSKYKYQGEIETTIAQINPNTGSIQFRALFPNPEQLLVNGSSGTIMIPNTYNNALVIPEQSTFEDQTLIYIFKLTKGDTLRKTKIEVKARIDNYVLVEKGLKTGDTVLGKGLTQVRDGTKIKPKPVPLDTIAGAIDNLFKQ